MIDLVLAVDPATTTGLAWYVNHPTVGEEDRWGSRSLKLAAESELRKLDLRFFDPRPVRLRRMVARLIREGLSTAWLFRICPAKVLIAFEDVEFAKSLAQVQLWGSLRGALWTVGEEFRPEQVCLSYVSLPVPTLKKFATGSGGAGKDVMLAAAKRYWPGVKFADDNEADARWLLKWAVEKFITHE